jgi:hypothetical protein
MVPDRVSHPVFVWLLSSSIIMTLVIIGLVIVGDRRCRLSEAIAIPDLIDVIVVDRGRGRVMAQVDCVLRFMPWVTRILIVYTTPVAADPTRTQSGSSQLVWLACRDETATVEALYAQVPSLLLREQQAPLQHFLFLGDTTIPLRAVPKLELWSLSKKLRLTNYQVQDAFSQEYEWTVPIILLTPRAIGSQLVLRRYLQTLILTHAVVYSPFTNHTIIFLEDDPSTNTIQCSTPHTLELFLTCLISPTALQTTTEWAELNTRLVEVMCTTATAGLSV